MANIYRNFKFYSGNRYIILATIETYTRTESGKSWKANPDEVERRVYDDEHYTNYVSAIPFFNAFGEGASCRGYRAYTQAGYLPIQVTTISPYREIKKVAHFSFIFKGDLERNAGNREKEIIEKASRFELFPSNNGRHYTTLIAGENSATFEHITWKWVN